MYHSPDTNPWFPSLEAALHGCPFDIPVMVTDRLSLIELPYWSFDGNERLGQMVIATARATETRAIFQEMLALRFPIEQMFPVAVYGWDDLSSMAANNTSAFNFRPKVGKEWEISNHALGVAIDINPRINPFYGRDGAMLPKNGIYDLALPGTIAPDGPVTKLFKDREWTWGGDWTSLKDYQHFEKP